MNSDNFIKAIQDFGYLELDLSTEATDCLYEEYRDKVSSLKQDVEDNMMLLTEVGDRDIFRTITEQTSAEVRTEIEDALKNVGISPEQCEKAIKAAVAI